MSVAGAAYLCCICQGTARAGEVTRMEGFLTGQMESARIDQRIRRRICPANSMQHLSAPQQQRRRRQKGERRRRWREWIRMEGRVGCLCHFKKPAVDVFKPPLMLQTLSRQPLPYPPCPPPPPKKWKREMRRARGTGHSGAAASGFYLQSQIKFNVRVIVLPQGGLPLRLRGLRWASQRSAIDGQSA